MFILSDHLCFLIGAFRQSVFSVIIVMVRFKLIILILISYLAHLFSSLSLFSCLLFSLSYIICIYIIYSYIIYNKYSILPFWHLTAVLIWSYMLFGGLELTSVTYHILPSNSIMRLYGSYENLPTTYFLSPHLRLQVIRMCIFLLHVLQDPHFIILFPLNSKGACKGIFKKLGKKSRLYLPT